MNTAYTFEARAAKGSGDELPKKKDIMLLNIHIDNGGFKLEKTQDQAKQNYNDRLDPI